MAGLTLAIPVSRIFALSFPNIVFILADDMGYGDLSCLNKDSKIKTENLDRLARSGMTFTDAHSPSGVCTPTRYGVVTGRYCWRSKLTRGVLGGTSDPLLEKDRLTVAALLKKQGYKTGIVGKWHLGLGWVTAKGKDKNAPERGASTGGKSKSTMKHTTHWIDFKKKLTDTPIHHGFDYFYGISASLDMPPYTYIENDKVAEIPTEKSKGGGFPKNWREGLAAKSFRHDEVMKTIGEKAIAFIKKNSKKNGRKPFFLYVPFTAPHTPVVPRKKFRGKSNVGDYGDFVMECDWTVGKIVETLEAAGVRGETLVIYTSDNGPEKQMQDRKKEFSHFSAWKYRGMKRDNWDGGHRVPYIVSWPGKVKAGSISGEIICLTDLMATAAEITGQNLQKNAGEDSVSIVPAIFGQKEKLPLREAIVHHSSSGRFSIRKGKWKLLDHKGSGGNRYRDGKNAFDKDSPEIQLYDMSKDPSEAENLYKKYPEKVTELKRLLEKYKTAGRST